MGDLKIVSVISVSSEEASFPASNLLEPESYKKWKCQSGTKQAIAILQFDKMHEVESVDIGNEGSAFIEILVGLSADSEKFEVLVPTCTFMSPADSKAWINCNAVKLFTKDKMNKLVSQKKWDRIKIVCHQHYNPTKQFGLSFIRVRSVSTDSAPELKKEGSLGQFKLSTDTSPVLSPGSLFFNTKEKQAKAPELSVAAKAREACNSPEERPAKVPKLAEKEEVKIDSERKVKDEKVESDISQVLAGVVFALSGYKNPQRGEIRDKATKLGAKYETDWSTNCTHLICAYENTPKYKQVVKSQASCIVKPAWIDECHKSKKRVSIKTYMMAKIDEPVRSFPKKSVKASPKIAEDGSDTDELSDQEMEWKSSGGHVDENKDYDSAYDASTEDEKESSEPKVSFDLLNLPNFLEKCVVLIYGDFEQSEQETISRYVIAYGGEVVGYMSDKVTHVISGVVWDDNFDEALSENSSLQFVKPDWLFACHSQQKLMPHQKYAIVPV